MTDKHLDFGHRCDSFAWWLTTCAGYVCEARCNHAVSGEVAGFVQGTEGASHDCGVLADELEVAGTTSTGHLEAIATSKPPPSVYGVDCKVTEQTPDVHGDGRGTFDFKVSVRPRQETCTAFVIQNPTAPHLVTLMPSSYFRNMHSERVVAGTPQLPTEAGARVYNSRSIWMSGPPWEPFPMEWSPTVLNFSDLPQAFGSLQTLLREGTSSWVNPSLGIACDGWQNLKPCSVDYLFPEPSSDLFEEGKFLRRIRDAFKTSSVYRVKEFSLRPLVGDFAISHTPSHTKLTVEVKRQICRLGLQDGQYTLHVYSKLRPWKPSMFTPFALWDLLLLTINKKPTTGFLLPRAFFPKPWFYDQEANVLSLPTNSESVNKYRVDLSTPETTVRDITRVLDTFLKGDRLRAPKLDLPFKDIIRDPVRDERNSGDTDEEISKDTATDVDEDFMFAPKLFLSTEHLLLLQQCRSDRGWFYPLGDKHPSATHAFAPGIVPGVMTFADLHPQTPMVLINMAQIDQLDRRFASDNRRSGALLRATHGTSRSIFILFPVDECMRQPHLNCFLVPSERLASPQRRKMSNDVISAKDYNKLNRNYTFVFDTIAQPLDLFACRRRDIVNKLHQMCSGSWRDTKPTVGDELETGLGTQIDLEEYVLTKQEVVRGYLPFAQGKPIWSADQQ